MLMEMMMNDNYTGFKSRSAPAILMRFFVDFLIPPDKYQDSTSNYDTAVSFHILALSKHPIIRCYRLQPELLKSQ